MNAAQVFSFSSCMRHKEKWKRRNDSSQKQGSSFAGSSSDARDEEDKASFAGAGGCEHSSTEAASMGSSFAAAAVPLHSDKERCETEAERLAAHTAGGIIEGLEMVRVSGVSRSAYK